MTIKEEYKRARKTLLQKIRRAEKRGYMVPENYVPDIPKRPTRGSIRRLRKLTEEIYKKSRHVDVETGEITKGEVAREKERSAASKKGALTKKLKQLKKAGAVPLDLEYDDLPSEADMVLSNFKSDIIGHFPESAGPVLRKWLDAMLSRYGKEKTAQMLQDAQENGVLINNKIAYSTELLNNAISDMMDFMDEVGDFTKDEVFMEIEYDEDWELPLE